MANFNQIQIIGFAGRDPDSRFMPNGDPVASVSVAVTEKYKENETVTWFDCSFFGKQSEVASKYLTKGSLVFIQGPVSLNTYQKKDGSQGASLRVIVREFRMLGSPGERAHSGKPAERQSAPAGGTVRTPAKQTGSSFDDMPDDVPF